jgi:hypothetical protein
MKIAPAETKVRHHKRFELLCKALQQSDSVSQNELKMEDFGGGGDKAGVIRGFIANSKIKGA